MYQHEIAYAMHDVLALVKAVEPRRRLLLRSNVLERQKSLIRYGSESEARRHGLSSLTNQPRRRLILYRVVVSSEKHQAGDWLVVRIGWNESGFGDEAIPI